MVDVAPQGYRGQRHFTNPTDEILGMQTTIATKKSHKQSEMGTTLLSNLNREPPKQTKVIVDKDALTAKIDNFNDNIQTTVTAAINSVEEGHASIKITSNLYEEKIEILKPGIEIRPKEKGGEVTIQQTTEPCFVIDIGAGNTCEIHNIRMLLKGPNRDAEPHSFMVDMNFEN